MTLPPNDRATLRDRAQVTLPASVRAALDVSPGDDLELEDRPSGDVVVSGLTMIPAD